MRSPAQRREPPLWLLGVLAVLMSLLILIQWSCNPLLNPVSTMTPTVQPSQTALPQRDQTPSPSATWVPWPTSVVTPDHTPTLVPYDTKVPTVTVTALSSATPTSTATPTPSVHVLPKTGAPLNPLHPDIPTPPLLNGHIERDIWGD